MTFARLRPPFTMASLTVKGIRNWWTRYGIGGSGTNGYNAVRVCELSWLRTRVSLSILARARHARSLILPRHPSS
jgi:hypothetical protein